MADENLRQLRVMHVVGSGGVAEGLQQSLLMPLLTRMPKARVKTQVAALAPGAVPGAVLRQQGVPVHEVALSRQRFALGGFGDLLEATRAFRPDVIQAWGSTAQLAANAVAKRCAWKPKVVWSVADTAPLTRDPGFIDRRKLKSAARAGLKADRIVYTSEAGASQHKRVGFPEEGYVVVPPGIDATRYKPDFEARRKVREQLKLAHDAIVIGMVAPFRPEFDHASLVKAVGELMKTNPHIVLLLAGHGIQKGNAPLMALVGGGTVGGKTHLLGEWSDLSAFFNACDVACSSALNDASRMTVVSAMLCGVPCVATGMGAQGEVIGQHGVAIEPGSATALARGITRILQLPPDKRAFMAQGARKHALTNYVYVRSLQKYLQLYYDLVGRQSLVTQDVPTPQIDPTVNVPPPLPRDTTPATAKGAVALTELSDPDSLETQVTASAVPVTWKAPPKPQQQVWQPAPEATSQGDVLETFESKMTKNVSLQTSLMSERARGVAEDTEELLAPEALETPAPKVVRGPSSPAKPALANSAPTATPPPRAAAKPLTQASPTSTPVSPPLVAAQPEAAAPIALAEQQPSAPVIAVPTSAPSVPAVAAVDTPPLVSPPIELASDVPVPAAASDPLTAVSMPEAVSNLQLAPTIDTSPVPALAPSSTPTPDAKPSSDGLPAARPRTGGLQLDLLDFDEPEQRIAV